MVRVSSIVTRLPAGWCGLMRSSGRPNCLVALALVGTPRVPPGHCGRSMHHRPPITYSRAKKDIGNWGRHDYFSTVSPRCGIREAVKLTHRLIACSGHDWIYEARLCAMFLFTAGESLLERWERRAEGGRAPPSRISFIYRLSAPSLIPSAFHLVYVCQPLSLVLASLNIVYHLFPSPLPPSFFELTRLTFLTPFTQDISEAREIGGKKDAYILLANSISVMYVTCCNINRKRTTILVLHDSRAMIDDVLTTSNLTPYGDIAGNLISHYHSLD